MHLGVPPDESGFTPRRLMELPAHLSAVLIPTGQEELFTPGRCPRGSLSVRWVFAEMGLQQRVEKLSRVGREMSEEFAFFKEGSLLSSSYL